MQRAESFFDEGNHSSAVIELKNALQKNPRSGQARLLLGEIYLELRRDADAEKELQLALDTGVDKEEILPLLAQALQQQGSNEALQALSLTGVTRPENLAIVLAAKGLGNLGVGEVVDARIQIEEALALQADSPYVRLANARLSLASFEADFAAEELRAILDQAPDYGPAWSLLGDIEASRDNFAEAEAAYTRAIETRPANLEDRLRRARILVRTNELVGAEQDLDILRERMPKHPEVLFARAQLHVMKNEWGEARTALESVLANGPGAREQETLFFLGTANLRLGNLAQAEDLALRFHNSVPLSIPGRKLLAAVMMTKSDYQRVRELLEPVVATDPDDRKTAEMLASALVRMGDTAAAVALFQDIVDANPDSANARLRLGVVLYSDDRRARGIEQLNKALELDPTDPATNLAVVTVLLDQEDYNSALEVAKTFQAAAPDEPGGQKLLARVYLASGQIEAGVDILEAIIDEAPADRFSNYALASLALQENHLKDARKRYEAVLAGSPDDLDVLLKLARLSAAAQDEAGMVEYLERAAAAHPEAAQPTVALARYHFARGDSEKVANLTLQLSDAQKQQPDVQEFLGLVNLSQKQYDTARFYLQDLVKQRPESGRAHYLLSRAYARLGQTREWRAELERSLELEPDNFLAHKALAYAWLLEGDLERASAELAEVEKRFPDAPDILHLRATIERGEGNQQQASELLEEAFAAAPRTRAMLAFAGQLWHSGDREDAIAVQEEWLYEHPDDVYASLALGFAYQKEGRTSDAVKQFEKLLARDRDNPDLLNALAWLLRQEETDRALRYALRAKELRPRDGNITDTLAVIYFYRGDLEQAASTIDQALKLLPGNPALRYHKALIEAAAGKEAWAAKVVGELLAEDTDFDERDEAVAFLETLK